MVRQYFDLLAAAYLLLPKPDTSYKNWPEILQKGLTDLQDIHVDHQRAEHQQTGDRDFAQGRIHRRTTCVGASAN